MKRLTRLQSIRKFCIQCMGGSIYLPTDCPAKKCKFYPYRLGRGGGSKGTVIRKYCLECVGSPSEVKNCPDLDCSLYLFRFGYASNQEMIQNAPIGRLLGQDSTMFIEVITIIPKFRKKIT
ncbi:MAG: hypothetical protein ISS29_01835 [Candidatus Marinimicrobia bacterium]|nr:hypothetical protein [Candidatus Neomarinimicrobiota bacterium]